MIKMKFPAKSIKQSKSRLLNINFKSRFPNILMTESLMKSGFALICLIVCLIQMSSILSIYFEYPSTVAVIRRPMRKLYVPGITLCNRNRIKLSKLKQWDKSLNSTWSHINDNSTVDKISQQKSIDRELRKMMKEMTVSQFMSFGHTFEDFIEMDYTLCASDKFNPDTPCKKVMNVITSVTDQGNCFTLFHKSRSEGVREMAIRPGFSLEPIKRGQESIDLDISEEEIHPNEVIRIKVNFRREESTTLNDPILGEMLIHDDNEIPNIREKSHIIEPGHYYEFYLRKDLSFLLPKPYSTDCTDYRLRVTEDYNPFLHNPLSKSDCVIGCMAQQTMNLCECWPPEVPFIKGSMNGSKTPIENTMKWCEWSQPLLGFSKSVKSVIHLEENQTLFDYCFAKHENKCQIKCNNNCRIKNYNIHKEARVWPSLERIKYSENKEYFSEMRNCCSIISIRYWGSLITLNEHNPKLQKAEFMSYIGGLLSMWIGFSFLGFYDLMAEVIKCLYKHQSKPQKAKTINKRAISGPYIINCVPRASYIGPSRN